MSYRQPGDGWTGQSPPPGQPWQQGGSPPAPPYGQPPYSPQPIWVTAAMVPTDQRDRTAMAVIAWILTVLTLLYFLPWAIGATRGKSDAGMIGLVNFLAGWTVIGWIACLVWACQGHKPLHPVVGYGAPPVWGPQQQPWQQGQGWGSPR